jgi:hypothetical protein
MEEKYFTLRIYFQQFICHPQKSTSTIQSKFLCLPDQIVLAAVKERMKIIIWQSILIIFILKITILTNLIQQHVNN